MGALLRWREPAVVVLLVVVLLRLLVVAGLGLASSAGAAGSYGLATYAAAGEAGEPVALVLLALLLMTCHAAPSSPRARALTLFGLVAVSAAVLVQLVVVVVGLGSAPLAQLPPPLAAVSTVERLLDLGVTGLAVLGLAVLVGRPRAATDPAPPVPTALAETAPAAAQPDPTLEPTWPADEAAGAVWLSAGDAASGRAPSPETPPDEQQEPHPWVTGPRGS